MPYALKTYGNSYRSKAERMTDESEIIRCPKCDKFLAQIKKGALTQRRGKGAMSVRQGPVEITCPRCETVVVKW